MVVVRSALCALYFLVEQSQQLADKGDGSRGKAVALVARGAKQALEHRFQARDRLLDLGLPSGIPRADSRMEGFQQAQCGVERQAGMLAHDDIRQRANPALHRLGLPLSHSCSAARSISSAAEAKSG